MSEIPNCSDCRSEYACVDGDHDIDSKIDEIGAMKLKSAFVKKA
jgi:uncharacterized Zn ribbon protein